MFYNKQSLASLQMLDTEKDTVNVNANAPKIKTQDTSVPVVTAATVTALTPVFFFSGSI